METIREEAAARRLARAIASDVALYNEDKLRSGRSVDAEVSEGRELFRKRVDPALWPLYDEGIELVLGARMGEPKANVPLADYRGLQRRIERAPAGPSPWPGRILLLSLVAFVFTLIVWALIRWQ